MEGRLPDNNNVYGTLAVGDDGLPAVMEALLRAHPWQQAAIRRSSYSGTPTLRVRSAEAEFETEPRLDAMGYSLNGSVAGDVGRVWDFVTAMSRALVECRIPHRFEVYDAAGVMRHKVSELDLHAK